MHPQFEDTIYTSISMNKLYCLFVCSIVCSLFLLSCATIKPAITEIPKDDREAIIYYREGSSPNYGGSFGSRKLTESASTSLFPSTNNSLSFLFEESSTLEPSLSPDGNYLIVEDNGNNENEIQVLQGEKLFNIIDGKTSQTVFHEKTKLPCNGHQEEAFSLPWSIFDNSFFISTSDTIQKCTTNGKRRTLAYVEGVTRFSVSPSEQWLLFVQDERIGLLNLETREAVEVKEFDEIFGIGLERCIQIVSWSPDDNIVAFAEGHRITIYNISTGKRSLYKTAGDVFALEWISNNEFIIVEGNNPAKQARLKDDPYFKILSLNALTMQDKFLHEQRNHEPSSVRPKLSPSGTLLLFSEKDIYGEYWIKLMTLDGQAITTVCNGHSPVWGK